MFVVPVVDLRRGQAVHAVRGERAAYRPVRSRLIDGSAPLAVARALLDAAAADTLYVADLDALLGEAPQLGSLRELLAALPDARLWLDAGFADAQSARAFCAALDGARVTPVLASESAVPGPLDAGGTILSLDRRGGAALDPAGWWRQPACWPERVIAMSLDSVGARAGPDLALLRELRERAPGVRAIGAGGIRDRADLAACAAAGAHAWLVASALHDGSVGAWNATCGEAAR